VLAMDDRSPVLGIPMGLVFSGLLICGCGMALILMQSLWRQAAGLMPAEELVASHEAQVE
jgi:TRAP-type C4-dicarboxylate transport system permease small subunit